MSNLRFKVVEEAFHKKPVEVPSPAERPSEYFAKYVFNREKMFKYLPSKVYAKLVDVIDNGAALDRSIANEVAAGMKKWATELGVTHYTHWFQPLTEGTAEKHDAFVEHDGKEVCSRNSPENCSYSRKLTVLLSQRRSEKHFRSTRIQRMGSFISCFCCGRYALHPDCLYRLYR